MLEFDDKKPKRIYIERMKPGIYVHLPFCAVHCTYCDFPLTTRLSLSHEYYAALFKEIALRPSPQLSDTLYFGGGTPSLTPWEVLKQLRERFRLEENAEITLEANPDDIGKEILRGWKKTGINRISIGVQSLQRPVLRRMLRRHTEEEAWSALLQARSVGFQNMNIDLIIGAPEQTPKGFFEGLEKLINFRPEHFSLYMLEVHEETALHKQLAVGKVTLMAEEEQLQCYTGAINLLQQSGYQHYEVSNFALPGYTSRHNLKYWSNASYAGYGAGACSYLDSTRITNLGSIPAYIEAVHNSTLPVFSSTREDEDTAMKNAVIFGLRKREGVDLMDFEKTYGLSALSLFEGHADEYLKSGLLEVSKGRLCLTLSGMLVSNEILSSVV